MDANAKETAKPRRRWFRFSLRTLLIVVTVLSVLLSWVGWKRGQVRKEKATIAWAEKMGGGVEFLSKFLARDARSRWEKTRDRLFGERVLGVYLHRTQVSDLSPLTDLKDVKWLQLRITPVSDLSPLAKLKTLERLALQNTQVSDLSPLAKLKTLEWLDLDNTPVSDLSPLVELKNLEVLRLKNTQVSDLSPLAELKNLKRLSFHNTQVSDLSSLAELKSLKELGLGGTQVSDEQVQELREALPNCEIHHSPP